MGKADRIITKAHRVSAGLFLLAMIPAGYASFKRDTASLLLYLPLPFLFRAHPHGHLPARRTVDSPCSPQGTAIVDRRNQ